MTSGIRAASLLVTLVLALGAAACDGGGDDDATTTPPTGSVTDLTSEAAAATVDALCRMASIADVAEAKATFYDDAHATLHAIARAAGEDEVGSDTDLLIAMQRVEAELEEPSLPTAYEDDVDALRLATVRTLERIDIDAPTC